MSTPQTTILYLGASRGVGFSTYSALALSRPDVTSVLLLRSIERFQATAQAEGVSEEVLGRTRCVRGDAHVQVDLERALGEAGEGLETIVTSIGGYSDPLSWVQGVRY